MRDYWSTHDIGRTNGPSQRPIGPKGISKPNPRPELTKKHAHKNTSLSRGLKQKQTIYKEDSSAKESQKKKATKTRNHIEGKQPSEGICNTPYFKILSKIS